MKSNSLVYRDFLIKCRANRGGEYLVPVSIQEIRLTPEDPDSDYAATEKPSEFFGEIREPLEKRGDLVKLKTGDRITRNPRIGKQVRPGRNGTVFVQVRVKVREWLQFTKRTEDPKLSWVLAKCEAAGLRTFIEGASWHAPVSYVHRDDYEAAWGILGPIDNIRDNAPRFRKPATV